MSKYAELKRLAEAAIEARPDQQYPTFGYAKAIKQFHEKSSPEAILALIAENERLQAERDALRAEVEGLRKDAERYRWICSNACDLNFYASVPAPIRGRVEIDEQQYPVSEWGSAKEELDSAIDAAITKEGGDQ